MARLLFDYDGTINDALVVYARAFRKIYGRLVAEGWAAPRQYGDTEISQWLGYSAKEMWQTFMPMMPQDQRMAYSRQLGEEMRVIIQGGGARWYPGAEAMLAALKDQGHTLVFLSNCRHDYQELHRRVFQMDRFFSGYYCTEDYNGASKVAIYPYIAKTRGDGFIVIGDRGVDMDIARVHSLAAIGCGYGYGRAEELSGANIVANHPNEIIEALEKLLE
ncbi:HAD family hydrolase [Eubacterium barkeri]|uniref:Phosphoglycolate phosphatase n=1 Tax=Eubacterium barkeri TaxID=1528 RepID=A0A1H3G4I9_EUBBA|nr:HAD hydrolase-like protein [Eubacterium barkeri]SDX97628.1 phosphoglycolate phosphatase [Eubacterium barkeri]